MAKIVIDMQIECDAFVLCWESGTMKMDDENIHHRCTKIR
jgi:hypothetical protein